MAITLNVQHLVLLGLLCAALHWVFARAEITRFMWSRAPRWLDKLLRCPACSGYWLGLLWYVLGIRAVGVESFSGGMVCNGLLAVVLTPVVETALLWGLQHSAVHEQAPEPAPEHGLRLACWSCGAAQGAVCTEPGCGNAGTLHTHAP